MTQTTLTLLLPLTLSSGCSTDTCTYSPELSLRLFAEAMCDDSCQTDQSRDEYEACVNDIFTNTKHGPNLVC